MANAVWDALQAHAKAKHHKRTQIQGETAILSLDGGTLVCVTRTDVAKDLLGRPDLTAKECLCVWDLETRRMRLFLRCGRPFEWAGVSPDSKTLVYCCADGSIGLWDLEKRVCQGTTQVKVSVESLLEGLFSPDSRYFATRVGPDNRRFTPYKIIDEARGSALAGYTAVYHFQDPNSVVYIYELATRRLIATWSQPETAINSTDWCEDSMFLAIATTRGVCLWSPTTDTEKKWNMRVFDHDIKRPRFISVHHILFVDQGRRLMFTTSRRTVDEAPVQEITPREEIRSS
ncbi:hypothetical protein BJX66DRAFT_334172 [Aspergillus keveii]|uniref:Uncharacterized protein n=1 Tax=Aspergillus keveii TaxID=714993 RepID=A0ABR4GHK0_9EURO